MTGRAAGGGALDLRHLDMRQLRAGRRRRRGPRPGLLRLPARGPGHDPLPGSWCVGGRSPPCSAYGVILQGKPRCRPPWCCELQGQWYSRVRRPRFGMYSAQAGSGKFTPPRCASSGPPPSSRASRVWAAVAACVVRPACCPRHPGPLVDHHLGCPLPIAEAVPGPGQRPAAEGRQADRRVGCGVDAPDTATSARKDTVRVDQAGLMLMFAVEDVVRVVLSLDPCQPVVLVAVRRATRGRPARSCR